MNKEKQNGTASRSDVFFRAFAGLVVRRAVWVIMSLVITFLVLASFLPELHFDTTTEGFLSENDPAIQRYESFKDSFGRDDFIVLAVHHPDIFSHDFIHALSDLHDTLENQVPWVEEVDSLVNARRIYGENDELIVEDLFESLPSVNLDTYYQERKRIVRQNPLYQRLLIDESLSYTTVVLKIKNRALKASGEYQEVNELDLQNTIDTTKQLVDTWQTEMPDAEVYMAGSPIIVSKLKEAMMQDMRRFTLLTLLTIALFLFLLFGRVSGVLLPLLVVLLSVVSTVALMAATGASIQLPTVILPSFILAVAVGDSVHFLSIFYQNLNQGQHHKVETEGSLKKVAICDALTHTSMPMLLTSLTTAAGLASFAFADIVPVSNLGIFAASGVMIAFLLSVTLLPACLTLLPIKSVREIKASSFSLKEQLDVMLSHFTDFCIRVAESKPKLIIILYLGLSVLAVSAASQLRFSHDPVVWLPDDWDIVKATRITDEKLRGTVSIELLVDTGEADAVKDPDFLRKLDKVNQRIADYSNENIEVRKIVSLVDIVKESNKALHNNAQNFYSIPETQDLVAQELFLLELSGADDLYDLVDESYQTARVTISIPWIDTIYYQELLQFITNEYRVALGDEIKVSYTGLVPILGNTLKAVITDTALSYAIAFAVISVLMIVMLASFKYGLLAMLPNVIPITFTFALMYVVSVPVDMFTMLIASIALGLSVDDTIHFMHHFKERLNAGDSVMQAIEFTLHTSGKAMLTTSIVLCCGFIIYTFSEMNNLDTFGAFTAITIVLALLADFLLAPALMIVSHQGHERE